MIATAPKKRTVKIFDWDKYFCHVSPVITGFWPTSTEVTVEFDDSGKLMIPHDHFPQIIQLLVSEQSEGQEGFLPTDGCLVHFKDKEFRLVYTPKGEDTCGWSLSGPINR